MAPHLTGRRRAERQQQSFWQHPRDGPCSFFWHMARRKSIIRSKWKKALSRNGKPSCHMKHMIIHWVSVTVQLCASGCPTRATELLWGCSAAWMGKQWLLSGVGTHVHSHPTTSVHPPNEKKLYFSYTWGTEHVLSMPQAPWERRHQRTGRRLLGQ